MNAINIEKMVQILEAVTNYPIIYSLEAPKQNPI
jgi:hypothetical protein